jgi:hypothetical protein
MSDLARPDGIEPKHIHEAGGSVVRRWPFGLAGLGVLLALAFVGVYGKQNRLAGSGSEVELAVEGPVRIRNGEFFEMVLNVETRRDIRDLVVLIGADLWRDVTVNTLLPDPSEHGFRDGSYEFRFGPLEAGGTLRIKVDGQINPSHAPSANEDTIEIADGEATLVTVNYAMEVLP